VAIATGGFSVHSAGIPYYNNMMLELLIIPVMIAGALPFKIYYVLYYKRNRISLFKDEQARLLFILIGLGIIVVTYDLFFLSGLDFTTSLRQGLFMTVAAVTSTGFQIASPNNWAAATVLFLTILMLVGGSSGSTAGGIKLSRIALGYRGIIWWFKRVFVSGKVLVPFKYEGKTIPGSVAELEVSKNMLIIILYLLVIFTTAIVVMHFDPGTFDTSNVLFEVVSGICNNGISTGLVSPSMSPVSKVFFIMIMWIGRLEVMPVIVLFMALFKGFDTRF
jgi:trk system potassium uptake protein TrkH